MDLCIKGDVQEDEIDDFVEEWHDSDLELGLDAFLGMTWEEYQVWSVKPSMLPFILYLRKNNIPLELALVVVEEFNNIYSR